MGLQDLSSCIGAFHCESAGVVGGALIDQTAYGNDLALVTGTPVFATRDGFEVMDFDNTFWFQGPNLLVSGGSVVVVGVCDLDGLSGSLNLVNTVEAKANAGNFDADPTDLVDADWLSSTYQRRACYFNANVPRIFDRSGVSSAGTAFTAGAMNIFTGCIEIDPAQTQGSTGTQAVVTSSFATASSAAREGSLMRIGHLKSGTITVGKYLSAKRIYFFAGNVFDHLDFSAARAAEIAAWGI